MDNLDKLIFEYLEEYAEKLPDHVAVVYKEQQIKYSDLNKKSNQLARILREKGVKRDSLVGIYMDRSIDFVISMMAIFKAGGAYVPLDPDYPKQRLEYIIEDSDIKLVITDRKYIKLANEMQLDAELIDLCDSSLFVGDDSNLHKVNTSNDLCYVIYTSGSTGRPKGALIEHAGMMNHMFAMMDNCNIGEGEHIAQNSSMCSDISVWQFLTAFVIGGTTVIYPYEEIINPEKFIKSIIRDEVTILEVVPSYLNIMLMQLKTRGYRLDKLKCLIVTGEAVNLRMVREWYDIHPNIDIVNAYGPTEASDDVTLYRIPKNLDTVNVPIGKPIKNIKIYIVDEMMKLCEEGEKGEICVSGIGVGRGYINNAEKTKQVFMEDPFIGVPGVRLYKTGDIGRILSDGNVEFLGRKDNQVKIRGFRVELQEIENEISLYPGISETAVIVKEKKEGNPLLYAFYTSKTEINHQDLINFISKNLPEHMIPSEFRKLDSFKLNPIGKIDRNALQQEEVMDEEVYNDFENCKNDDNDQELIMFFEKNLDISFKDQDLNQSLDKFGINSINFIQLVVAIESNFNIRFDEDNLDYQSLETLSGLLDYVKNKR